MTVSHPVRIEISAGGVIYRYAGNDGSIDVLLIRDGYDNWGFPKGHLEGQETSEEAALRECREETGLDHLETTARVGMTDWYFRDGAVLVHKFCDYFLLRADPAEEARPQRGEGIRACEWLAPEKAITRVTYDNARHILGLGLELGGVQLPGSS